MSWSLKRLSRFFSGKQLATSTLRVLKKGHAMRVVFFYPGEEGTYIDAADVVIYENGIVHIVSQFEETTTHLQNCEILWSFAIEGEERKNNVRLLKPAKGETQAHSVVTPLGPPRSDPELPQN